MSQDHQLTFDWILYVILVPPVLFALWLLYRNREDERRAQCGAGKVEADGPSSAPSTGDQSAESRVR